MYGRAISAPSTQGLATTMVESLVSSGTDRFKRQAKRVVRPLIKPVTTVHRLCHERLEAQGSRWGTDPAYTNVVAHLAELDEQVGALRVSSSGVPSPAPPPTGDMRSAAVTRLSRLLNEPIVVIDVGCRWGFADVWADLGDRAVAIGFDPDVEECERL